MFKGGPKVSKNHQLIYPVHDVSSQVFWWLTRFGISRMFFSGEKVTLGVQKLILAGKALPSMCRSCAPLLYFFSLFTMVSLSNILFLLTCSVVLLLVRQSSLFCNSMKSTVTVCSTTTLLTGLEAGSCPSGRESRSQPPPLKNFSSLKA